MQLAKGIIQPTKYYDIVKNAYEQLYGQPSERVFPTASQNTSQQKSHTNKNTVILATAVWKTG